MLRLLQIQSPFLILGLLLYSVLLRLIEIPLAPATETTIDDTSVSLISGWLNEIRAIPFLSQVCVGLIVGIKAILLNVLLSRFKFTVETSWIFAFLYITLLSLHSTWSILTPNLLIALLFILLLNNLVRMYDEQVDLSRIFNLGLVVGTATLISPTCVLWLLYLFTTLLLLRTFNFREYLVVATGFVVPIVLAAAFGFAFFDRLTPFHSSGIGLVQEVYIQGSLLFGFTLFTLFALFSVAILDVAGKMGNRIIQVRRFTVVIMLSTILFSLQMMLAPILDWLALYAILLPLTVFIAKFIVEQKKRMVGDAILLTLCLLVVVTRLTELAGLWQGMFEFSS